MRATLQIVLLFSAPLLSTICSNVAQAQEAQQAQQTKDDQQFENAVARLREAPQAVQYGAVVDFRKPDIEPRFFVIELDSGNVVARYVVSHGRGSDPGIPDARGEEVPTGMATRFSNHMDTGASSLGLYEFRGEYRHGSKHPDSMVLHGMDETNSNADKRFILIHQANYVEADQEPRRSGDRIGRSCGCFALAQQDYNQTKGYLIKGSRILAIGPQGVPEDEDLPLDLDCCNATNHVSAACLKAYPELKDPEHRKHLQHKP